MFLSKESTKTLSIFSPSLVWKIENLNRVISGVRHSNPAFWSIINTLRPAQLPVAARFPAKLGYEAPSDCHLESSKTLPVQDIYLTVFGLTFASI